MRVFEKIASSISPPRHLLRDNPKAEELRPVASEQPTSTEPSQPAPEPAVENKENAEEVKGTSVIPVEQVTNKDSTDTSTAEKDAKRQAKLAEKKRKFAMANWRKMCDRHRMITGVGRLGHHHVHCVLEGEKKIELMVRCDRMPTKEILGEVNGVLNSYFVVRM